MALQVWLPLNGNLNNQGSGVASASGGTSTSSGKIGSCYSANSSNYISIPYTINTTTEFSICFWMKMPSTMASNTDWETVLKISGYDSTSGSLTSLATSWTSYQNLKIWDTSNHQVFWLSISDLGGYGTWNHICITHTLSTSSGSKLSVYCNGVLKGSSTTTEQIKIASGTATLGQAISTTLGPLYFNDFRIYDECLSEKEIKEIAKALVVHYPLNDGYIEPTSNLCVANGIGGWNNSGAATRSSNDTSIPAGPIAECPVYSIIQTTAGNSAGTFSYVSASSFQGKQVTASCWVYLSGTQTSSVIYLRSAYTDGSICNFSYNNSTNPSTWPQNQWIRISGTGTVNSAETQVYFCTYTNNLNEYRAFNGWQLEVKDHVTPYVKYGTSRTPTVQDISGYNHNGEVNNSSISILANSSPRYDKCLYNPSTTYPIKGTVNMPASNALTFSWWMNCSAWGLQTSGLWSTSNSNAGDYYTTAANMRDSCFDCCNTSGTCERINVESYIVLNAWHHYALTYDGSNLKFYKDGILCTTTAQTGNLMDFTYIYLFYSYAGGCNRVCIGNMSDFRIYATCLSIDDIKLLYNSPIEVTNNGSLITQGEVIEV